MSGTFIPFLRTFRWRRLALAAAVFAAWHGYLYYRVQRAASDLGRTAWPTSRRVLAEGFAVGLPETNLPASIARLAFELRGTKPETVPDKDPEPPPDDPSNPVGQPVPEERFVPRFVECGHAGIIATPLPFLRYSRFRNSVDNHAATLAGLAKARSLVDCTPPADLLRDREPPGEWLVGLSDLAILVQLQALVAARDGKADVAADAIGDLLLIARSLGEFPNATVQAKRGRIIGIASRTVAMVASATRLDDAQWASIEAAFAREGAVGTYGTALRGWVAGWGDGTDGRQKSWSVNDGSWTEMRGLPLWITEGFHWISGTRAIDRCQAIEGLVLRIREFETDGVGFQANADDEGSRFFFAEFSQSLAWQRPRAWAALGAIQAMREQDLATLADARVAALACAVERHRLAHGGEPPADASEIAVSLLPHGRVPEDPFSGCPLEYNRGCTIYRVSTGLNGWDNHISRGREYFRETLRYDRDMPFGGWWGALTVQY